MGVCDTKVETRDHAEHLVSKLEDVLGRLIRQWAHDSRSLEVSRQACARALGRSADQVLSEIQDYRKMGICAFIFPSYPHLDEAEAQAEAFGTRVLPQLKTCSLPHACFRVPASVPQTPLGAGSRR